MSSTNWLIGISGNWNIGGYWSAGIPNSTGNVTISAPGEYVVSITSAATASSLDLSDAQSTLFESSTGSLALSNGLTVTSAAAILTGSNDIAGGITLGGDAFLEFDSTAALAGGSLITFDQGELLADGTAAVTGGIEVNGSADIAAATGATLTVSGFYKAENSTGFSFGDAEGDDGTVVLDTTSGWSLPANDYNVSVESGTLKAGDDGIFIALLANGIGTYVAAGASVDFDGFNTTINNLTGAGTIETSRSEDQPPKLTLTAPAADQFDGQIVGRISVEIAGAITFTGTNTYTGGTLIDDGAGLSLGGASGSIVGNVDDNGQLISDVTGATTIAGNITGSGEFFQNGSGVTTLSGTNSLADGVVINDGTLAIAHVAALGAGDITQFGGELLATANMTLTNPLVLGGGANIVDISAATGDTLTLNPTGGWNVQGGELVFGDGTNFGTVVWDTPADSGYANPYSVEVYGATLKAGAESLSALLGPATETFLFGGTIDVHGFATSIGNLQGFGSIVNSGGGTPVLSLNNGDFDGSISGKIALNVAGDFILDGASTYSGGTVIDANGALALGDGTNSGSITGNVLDNGSLFFSDNSIYDFTGKISGTGDVLQMGPGTIILDNVNNFTGGVMVGGGIAEIYAGNGLGTGLLTMQGGELLGATAAGGTTTTINVTDGVAMSGVVDFSAATGDTLAMKGEWVANNNPGGINAFNFGDGTNDGTVVWYSPTGSNDIASNFTVTVESGTLKAGDGNLSELLALDTTTTVDAGATLNFAGFSTALDGLEGAGAVVSSGSNAITVTLTDGNFTGTITGSMTFDLFGEVTLTGANKFTLADIETNAELILGGVQKENVAFLAGGTTTELALEKNAKLTGTLSGFGSGDTIDLQGVTYGSGTTLSYNSNTGVLTVSDGTHTENLTMSGFYVSGNFELGADPSIGTDVLFNPNPAVVHKAETFDFSQPSTAPAPMAVAALEPESQTPAAHLMPTATGSTSDLIDHLLTSHHAPAFYDFAFA